MPHQVSLAVFEGPFDLLLELIARRRLDVADVDLADITTDYLASLAGIEDLDLDQATSFLVVAATLVELKAARLLPAADHSGLDELLGQARDVLYARLLEYRAFRQLAEVLARRLDANRLVLGREAPLDPHLKALVPDTALPVDAAGLAALAASVTARIPLAPVDVSHIRQAGIGVRAAARLLLAALPEDGDHATFAELTAQRPAADRVAFFLAVLELYKLGRVQLVQPDHRDALEIRRHRHDDGDEGDPLGELPAVPDEPAAPVYASARP